MRLVARSLESSSGKEGTLYHSERLYQVDVSYENLPEDRIEVARPDTNHFRHDSSKYREVIFGVTSSGLGLIEPISLRYVETDLVQLNQVTTRIE